MQFLKQFPKIFFSLISNKKKTRSIGFFFILSFLGLSLKWSIGPDFDLFFYREIPSEINQAQLFRNIENIHRWPQWFYHLKSVEISSHESSPPTLQIGSQITLKMDPKKTLKKPFHLKAEIISFIPNKKLGLKIISDSTHRLTGLFSSLEWNIELLKNPKKTGTLIRGTAKAHTQHWKARFFGRLSEKILMNQIFHPDLMKLSTLRRPFENFLEKKEVDLLSSQR